MKQDSRFFFSILIALLFMITPLTFTGTVYADKLEDAISQTPQGTGKGQIDRKSEPGFLAIPGAPEPILIIVFNQHRGTPHVPGCRHIGPDCSCGYDHQPKNHKISFKEVVKWFR